VGRETAAVEFAEQAEDWAGEARGLRWLQEGHLARIR
jgi:hypothetical protein